ncbi:gliding motility-associated C-terminal domain-containing protein [Maribellus mangrovi]|uniref:T9SS type B sorting domain-containing protein n=1 Tax=Maribellus mangrovi TaxID=3133146 RepID=UPI0030EE1EB7
MEDFLIYIAKSSLAAGAFYLLYLALFQNRKHFVFNRIYLPVSLALSFLIPLLSFTSVRYIEAAPIEYNGFAYLAETSAIPVVPEFQLLWYHYLTGLYLLGLLVFFIYLILGHLKALSIVKNSRITRLFNVKVNVTLKDVHPFSFFNKIVISEKTLENPSLPMIIQHEEIHVREKHTLDILFSELLFLLQWFNPFTWLIKNAIKDNLEYKTDHEVVKTNNPQVYQVAMLELVHKQGVAPFLTALNGSQLKNRIIMMKKKTKNKYVVLKQLVVLPLLAVLIMGLSNKEVKTEIIQSEVKTEKASKENKGEENSFIKVNSNKIDSLVKKQIDMYIQYLGSESAVEKYFDKSIVNIKAEMHDVIEDQVLRKEIETKEAKILNEKYETATILTGDEAVQKYGEVARDASVIDLVTGEPNVTISSDTSIKDIYVSGKITDSSGNPLSGVAVLEKGTTSGTISDPQGKYKIYLTDEGASLVYVMAGFAKQEIPVEGHETINVQLESEKETKSAATIRINSLNSNDPLYVVDGKVQPDIEYLNPDGIQSIDVLKGESATSAFGDLGKNGVIIITTKKPSMTDALVIVDGKKYDGEINDISPEEIESISVLKGSAATEVYGEAGKNGVIIITSKKDKTKKILSSAHDFGNQKKHLVLMDGEKIHDIGQIDPRYIRSVNELKEEAAVKKYGDLGKDGVIEVTLKTPDELTQNEIPVVLNGKSTSKKLNEIDRNLIEKIQKIEVDEATEKYGNYGRFGVLEVTTKENQVTSMDNIKIPEGFTPNGDGIHDVFEVRGLEKVHPDFEMQIFNSEKELIWKYKHNGDPNTKPEWWNGKNKKNEIENGTYSYVIEYNDGSWEKSKSGTLLLATSEIQNITSELDLRRFIARKIAYPEAARLAGRTGIVSTKLKFDDTGEKIKGPIHTEGPQISLDEVVVVGYKPDNLVEGDFETDLKLLMSEVDRVTDMLPAVDIPRFKGKTVVVNVKFVLQEKTGGAAIEQDQNPIQLNKHYQFVSKVNGTFFCRGTFVFESKDENGLWHGTQINATQHSEITVTAKVVNNSLEIYTPSPWNETWKVTAMENGVSSGIVSGDYSLARNNTITFELSEIINKGE